MRDTGFQPGCSSSSSSPHVDHADQLSGEVAQSERVQPEGDHPEQHLWRKPHGKHLRAERGWGGSRQAPRSRRRRRKEGGGPGRPRTCSKAPEEASRVVWRSTSREAIRSPPGPARPGPAPPAGNGGGAAAVAPRSRQRRRDRPGLRAESGHGARHPRRSGGSGLLIAGPVMEQGERLAVELRFWHPWWNFQRKRALQVLKLTSSTSFLLRKQVFPKNCTLA